MSDTEEKPKITGNILAEKGLEVIDTDSYGDMMVANEPKAGEVSEVDWMKVFALGKALAAMQDGVPKHCRGKWGICARIAANAVQWRLDPFSIADQTYMVGDRLSYMSQIIHALIERNAPLQHRLDCEYSGEIAYKEIEQEDDQGNTHKVKVVDLNNSTRACRVIGQFATGEERPYDSPMVKDIKVKNSPLWVADTDQQLFYYSVRAWGRKWVPEILMGVYTKEELEADRTLGYEETTPGLRSRFATMDRHSTSEGHSPGYAAKELDQIAANPAKASQASPVGSVGPLDGTPITPAAEERTSEAPSGGKIRGRAAKARKEPKKAEKDAEPPQRNVSHETLPKTVAEYIAYANEWIMGMDNPLEIAARWGDERNLRNSVGLTADHYTYLENLKNERMAWLEDD